VGGRETVRVNIRIVAATHRNLEQMMARGTFRADLFFRLRVFPIVIPPLRERKNDIPALVRHFIEKKSKEMKRTGTPVPSPEAMARLMQYHWPGNIRELENAVERALILNASAACLSFQEIHPAPFSDPAPLPPVPDLSDPRPQTLDQVTIAHITRVLLQCQGRVEGEKGAARYLDINPSTLRKRMKKLGIPFGRNAQGKK
jgi:DNA-binding NtrC family response regulator